ncbi:MAG: 23S rRNA (guanosine(2251)-2'-O)-methyltransferase RlmB [Cyanobacteriota bacterium]
MGPSANDFSNRRRPDRRGDGPGMGPGRGPARGPGGGSPRGPGGGPRDGARGRTGRGLSDPRRPSASTFRRLGPRPEGPGAFEGRRGARDRDDRSSAGGGEGGWRGEVVRRGEGGWRGEGGGQRRGPTDDRPRWRMARRPEAPPARPFRPLRAEGPPPDSEPPRGDAHASAAPSELIWGRHAAQAALESERPIHRIWCTPEMRFRPGFLQLLREAKASGALVEEVSWARLGQISGGAVHQGIVLQPAAADTLDLPSLIDGGRHLGESPLLVAVDGLTDPQNLGAILRSAEALGVHGLVLPQRRNAGLTGSVAKVAAGALEHLPVARVVNLNRSLETLRQEGYRVVGLDPRGNVSLEEADLEGPLVVITGSEGQGLSVLTRRSCDQLVRIPLRGSTPSLNASVATALVLYEVARRGWMRGLRGMAKPPRLVRPNVPTEAAAGPTAFGTPETAPLAPESLQDVPLETGLSEPARPVDLALEDAPSAAEPLLEAPSAPPPPEATTTPEPNAATARDTLSAGAAEAFTEAPTAPAAEPPPAEPLPVVPAADAAEAPAALPAPSPFASDIHL